MISFYNSEQTAEKILKRKNLSSIHRVNNKYNSELVITLKKGKRLTMEQVREFHATENLVILGSEIEDDKETIRIEVLT